MNKSVADEKRDNDILEQINNLRSEIDYTTRDYAIDYLVNQFKEDEFFIPSEYQRNFVWKNDRKCRFVESILLGYPIPFMFFSDNDDGRSEIVDGAQRMSTLEEFLDNSTQIIRDICDDHGISFVAPPESRGGVKIDEVTALRNALAHGGKSFVECGRDFTLSDLKRITGEIEKFLEGLLDGMTVYYNNQQWATAL